jgi:hypothetical protein
MGDHLCSPIPIGARSANANYSQAVHVAGLVFVSGQAAFDPCLMSTTGLDARLVRFGHSTSPGSMVGSTMRVPIRAMLRGALAIRSGTDQTSAALAAGGPPG